MNNLILLVLGLILINSFFTLIPIFLSDLDPGLYLPYQFWINILLLFNFILPSRLGRYLFDNIKQK